MEGRKEGRKEGLSCTINQCKQTLVNVRTFFYTSTAVPVGLMFSFYLSPWSDVSTIPSVFGHLFNICHETNNRWFCKRNNNKTTESAWKPTGQHQNE